MQWQESSEILRKTRKQWYKWPESIVINTLDNLSRELYTYHIRFSPVCGCKQPRVLSHTSLSYCMRGKTHLKQINWKVLSYFIINPSVFVGNFWRTSCWENWLSQKIQFNISNVVCKLTASGTSQEGNIVPVIIDIHFGNLFIKGKVCFCNTNRSGIHSTQHKELELQTTVVSIITQHFSEDSAFRILLICIKLSLAFTDPTDKYFVLIEHFRGAQIYWFAFTEAGVRCSHCRSQLSNIGWFLLRNWQLQLQWIRATGNWYVMAPPWLHRCASLHIDLSTPETRSLRSSVCQLIRGEQAPAPAQYQWPHPFPQPLTRVV